MVRLIVLGLLFASPASLPALAVQATDWDATWDELEGLLAAPEAEGVPAARERLVGVAQRATPDPRGRLLAAWLERSAGGAGAPRGPDCVGQQAYGDHPPRRLHQLLRPPGVPRGWTEAAGPLTS